MWVDRSHAVGIFGFVEKVGGGKVIIVGPAF